MSNATTSNVIGWDTETFPIASEQMHPRIVCLSYSMGEQQGIEVDADPDGLACGVWSIVEAEETVVAHNAAYDLGVLAANFPDLLPRIFERLEEGHFADTMIREKLLVLADTGDLDYATRPDGSKERLSYGLAALVMRYMQVDLSASKKAEDAWRLNYNLLSGKPLDEWPPEAVEYAVMDAVYAERVYLLQENRRQEMIAQKGIDPFVTEGFRVSVSFALGLMSAHGFRIDAAEKDRIAAMVEAELTPDKLNLLLASGILVPAEAPRPHARGAKDADGNVKMTKGVAEKINAKRLKEYVEQLCTERPDEFELRFTDPSERFPEGQIQVDKDWLADFASLDPVLEQYQHRQNLQKLVSTYLPGMEIEPGVTAPIIHAGFNPLVSTGRTSSYDNKIVPSMNLQNMDPRVRTCFIPRDGYLLYSIDFSGMELGTAAQTCINLFGHSKLAEIINNGVDAHAYLGAQIARASDTNFSDACRDHNLDDDPDKVYQLFMQLPELLDGGDGDKFVAHYRKLAKPTGLGYPGGLGPDTFVRYAKTIFNVEIDKTTAEKLRELWKNTFPEMRQYLEWINQEALDPHHPGEIVKVTKDGVTHERMMRKYAYMSPYGMYRAGCDYCAAANGMALQTPSAEGACTAVWEAVRACCDSTRDTLLSDDLNGPTTRVLAFVHDELLGEVRDDELAHDRVTALCDIMTNSMKQITPNVVAKVEAALMRRWDKRAKPVFNENKRLTVWEPETNVG